MENATALDGNEILSEEEEAPKMTLEEATEIIDTEFAKLQGQTIAKRRFKSFILGAFQQDGFLPPILVAGPPGWGKTRFLSVVRGIIKRLLGKTPIYFKTTANCGTPTKFFEEVLTPHVAEKKALVVFDEFHEGKPGIMELVRQMLEITIDREAQPVTVKDYEMQFDPFLHAVIAATNEVDKIPAALMSRFERIDLAPFSDEEMEAILFDGLKKFGVRFAENSLRAIAECNRGSARDINKWVNAITAHLSVLGKQTMNKADVAEVIKVREMYPLGVSRLELNTLLILEEDGEQQLQELAMKNQCASAEQKTNERYLMQRGLITVDGKRLITNKGRTYLESLRADGYLPKKEVKKTIAG